MRNANFEVRIDAWRNVRGAEEKLFFKDRTCMIYFVEKTQTRAFTTQ